MHLDVDHSTLSQWLRGRRPLTARTIEALAGRLDVPRHRIREYIEYAAHASSDGDAIDQLTSDTACLIGDWYHFAILELVRLDEFRPDSRWIAQVLGISVDEVNVALQRLLRLDLLEMNAQDCWTDKSGDAAVSVDALGAAAIGRLQEQVQRLSVTAVRDVPLRLRDHTSITVAVNTARLPQAFELVARFRRQLVELLHENPRDDVYRIEVAIFPVTTLKRRDGASVPSPPEANRWDVP